MAAHRRVATEVAGSSTRKSNRVRTKPRSRTMPTLNKSLLHKLILNSKSRFKRKRRKVDPMLNIINAISRHTIRDLKRQNLTFLQLRKASPEIPRHGLMTFSSRSS